MSGIDPAETFRLEAQDLLEQLEQALLDLDHAPGDKDLVDTAFRALHTLKGSGSMFGFDRLAAFTHHVETAFDLVRKGKAAISHDLIAVTLKARDQMRALIEAAAEASDTDGEAILAELGGLVDALPAQKTRDSGTETAADGAPCGWHIRFRLPANAMAMGTNPLLLLAELRAMGDAVVTPDTTDIPDLEDLNPTDCHVAWDVRLTTTDSREMVEQVFLFVLDETELTIEPIYAETGGKEAPETAPENEEAAPDEAPSSTRTASRGGTDMIRVPAQRLDDLMDRVGELVIAQSRLKQLAARSFDTEIKSVAEDIERLALELRDSTMGVRMVPFGSLFGRFRRLVHDLSRDLGKDIRLVTRGEDTELDKTVIERLNDPLIHLIRNAVDHGLEDAAGRTAAGKPAEGRITLAARHVGAEVLISLTDDGRGLDAERIRARAEANGLIAPDAVLTESELYQLIFQPGFSTAQEVTSLSGRGVGMDVVKRTIEELRGTIDIASTPGKGTEITLRLPLTLAIIDGLLVRVGEGRYVIPLTAVEECVELPPREEARTRNRSFLSIRDELVPFLRLRDIFHCRTPADPYQKVVIVSSGELRVGLVVDQVIGDHQTVIKSLSPLHADVDTFSGATILGDGSVALILEIPYLVRRGQAEEQRFQEAG